MGHSEDKKDNQVDHGSCSLVVSVQPFYAEDSSLNARIDVISA